MAVGAGASRLSAVLASGYEELLAATNGGPEAAGGGSTSTGSIGLGEAVRLSARVLSRERARERKSRDIRTTAGEGEGDGERRERQDFGDIGMEIATIAVEGGGGKGGAAAAASLYIYSDEEVERLLESLEEEDVDGKGASSGSSGDKLE